MRKSLAIAMAVALAAVGLSLAAPVASAAPDVCLSYWFCVVKCAKAWIAGTYCGCAPECPPPPQDPW